MNQAMEDMYAKGILKAIGVSNFDQSHYDAFIAKVNIIPMVNQMESHVYFPNRQYQQYLASNGTIMQSWGPFSEGKRDIFDEPLLVEIGQNHGKTSAQIALRYLYQLDIPVIPKSHQLSRIQSNRDILDFRLSDEEMISIDSLNESEALFDWYGSRWI